MINIKIILTSNKLTQSELHWLVTQLQEYTEKTSDSWKDVKINIIEEGN